MLKRFAIVFTIGAVSVVALLIAGLTLPTGKPGTVLYYAAKSTFPLRAMDMVWSSNLPEHPTGDFLLHDGRLYLKVQTIYHHFIDDGVSFTHWTPERLSALLREHPELAPYFPDSGKPDGGIAWLNR
jgi:hypothetical protein